MANIQNAVTVQEVESDLFELQSAFRRQRVLPPMELRGLGEKNGEKCFIVWKGLLKCYIPVSETSVKNTDEMIFMLGSKVSVMVIDVDRKNVSVTLSVNKAKERLEVETRKTLKVNEIRTGIVQQITKKRAIVDLGGVDAFLSREEASWLYVGHLKESLKLGDEIRVKVMEISPDGDVHVSKKELEQDPWPTITKQIEQDQAWVAEVTGVNGNRVFIKLHDGVAAMATVPPNYPFPITTDKRVVVRIGTVKGKKKITASIIRVID